VTTSQNERLVKAGEAAGELEDKREREDCVDLPRIPDGAPS
jgi:hypothetical protein